MHKQCYEVYEQEEKEKERLKQEEAEKKKAEKEAKAKASAERKKAIGPLYDYICKIFHYDEVPARIIIQIRQMQKEYGFTESGILKTLQYFYEVKQGTFTKANGGIGIVPYVYDEAKKFYYRIYLAQQGNTNKSLNQLITTENITIKAPKRKGRKRKLMNVQLSEEGVNEE